MKRPVVVAALGTAQTLAWGSSYYLPAIWPIRSQVGSACRAPGSLPSSRAHYSLSAVLGPVVGRVIDDYGGRGVRLSRR
jgi:hypothetical protein